MDGDQRHDAFTDRELVEAVLRDLDEHEARWEALIAASESVTYSVDMGDIQAVANSDGKLIELTLHPDAMVVYTHAELADRLNTAFAALRDEALCDHEARHRDMQA
jgi:hypothetical protein